MEVKISEIRHGSLHLVRKCRVVTYLMGRNRQGLEEVVAEVNEETVNDLIAAIAEAQKEGPTWARDCGRTVQ